MANRHPALPYVVALFVGMFLPSPSFSETLDNKAIVELSSIGLGNDAIIAKIKSSTNTFDLSTAGLVSLKRAQVPDSVIAAMLEASGKTVQSATASNTGGTINPTDMRPSGIYLFQATGSQKKMIKLDPTTSAQTKNTGFLASAFTYGIAKQKIKTVLPNPTARTQTLEVRPVFYFYFDQSTTNLSQGGNSNPLAALTGQGQPVTSPNEFTLVRLDVKAANREIELGSFNLGGLKTGVMDKQRVPFTYEEIAPGIFQVSPTVDLTAGEYGFLYASAGGGGMAAMYGLGGQSARIFDFGVKAAQ